LPLQGLAIAARQLGSLDLGKHACEHIFLNGHG
jgi:hypothetical protein